MKCSKCGKELSEGDKFCRECGQVVGEEPKTESITETKGKVEIKKEEVKSTPAPVTPVKDNSALLCGLSLACFFGGPILLAIIIAIFGEGDYFVIIERMLFLLPLIAYGLCIYARIKYPQSTFAKVLLIVYIVLFVAAIFLLIIFLVACFSLIENCGSDCSSMGALLQMLLQ